MTGEPTREQAEAWPVEPPAGTRLDDTLAWYSGQYTKAVAAVSLLVTERDAARKVLEAVRETPESHVWIKLSRDDENRVEFQESSLYAITAGTWKAVEEALAGGGRTPTHYDFSRGEWVESGPVPDLGGGAADVAGASE